MCQGTVAPCGGLLISPRRSAQCTADAENPAGCRERLAGEAAARVIADETCRADVGRLELALDAERQAARVAVVPESRTDWSAVGWGVVVGVVAGVAAAVAVACAVR